MLYRTAAFVVALLLGVAGLSSTATAEVGSCGSGCSGPCTGFLIRSGTCQSSNGQCVCVPNTPAPGECALACDGRPCVTHCKDGTTASGFCTDLTIDTGCDCSAACGTPSPTPTPPPGEPTGICCQTDAGAVPQCTVLSPFSSQAYQFCLAIGVPYLNPPFGCSQQTGMCEAATPTPIVTPTQTPPTTFTPVPCLGDCDGDGKVTVDELVVAVGMVLADPPLSACPVLVDHCNPGCGPGPAPLTPPIPRVTVDCLVRAVNNALTGCPPARCSSDQDCDDGNPCTFDHCTPAGCVNECVCV